MARRPGEQPRATGVGGGAGMLASAATEAEADTVADAEADSGSTRHRYACSSLASPPRQRPDSQNRDSGSPAKLS